MEIKGNQCGLVTPSTSLSTKPASGMARRTVISLQTNWVFRQADSESEGFLPVAQFPTNVHLDLLQNKLIPDPFIGKNENLVQWVGEKTWIYKTTFFSPKLLTSEKAVLAFDGLDTYATVVLNHQQILKTDNMFIPERVNVTKLLNYDRDNVLEITFDPTYIIGKKIVEKYPNHHWGCWNGDPSRLAVRKAQYHYGWDWGPTLMTCGPWKPILLEVYTSRISDLCFTTDVDKSLESARVVTKADIEGEGDTVTFELTLDDQTVESQTVNISGGLATTTFDIQHPKLWYPAKYGQQPLYHLTATLQNKGTKEDIVSKRLGIRKAELIQRKLEDQPGTSFFFEVNNIPVFCGGSDWIPADNFLPRISPKRYRDWVKLVVDGNQVMIRVWAGGIFEAQAFYDACDEMGVLVWQDFLFGCGNYPAHPEFLESVKREATENVKLLRHHPCIVIYAGNNEDYQYQESEGLTYDPGNHDSKSWLKTDFPARYIYEKVLVDVTKELVPNTYYHFGSPYGGKNTTDPTVGDLHQWNVWHGTQEKYQNFDKLVGRFVSEFGMEAFPNMKTIDAYLPEGINDPDRYPQSSTVDFHNKADGHERRIALYLVENMQYKFEPFEQYVYCTQLMQAECIASAYRLWKRQWKGPGREYCAGVLVWQINDCWPVTSWAIVDYYLRPKHAYYTVKRELEPITIGLKRTMTAIPEDKYTGAYIKKVYEIEMWASNLTLENRTCDVQLKAWDVVTGEEMYSKILHNGFTLEANRSVEITKFEVPVHHKNADEELRTVVAAYLVESGKQVARYVNWPEPLKYTHLQKPKNLAIKVSHDATMVQISAEVPVKGVALYANDDSVAFEDNCVDIVPGETVFIGVKGLKKSEEGSLTVRYLGL
ncbi:MAG: Beta-mannosidase B [Cirrosporium novae-zelandiae]|nr:MAG: Beta-mannosidase B [Cirrosporium novae-zelandiae]